MLNAIKKFELETNFQIQPYLQNKTGFDLIKGFYQAFLQYKNEISKIEKMYTDFFNGVGYNKIEPEHISVLGNLSWFLEIFTKMQKHYKSSMTSQDNKDYNDFIVDICQFQLAFNNFINSNQNNFSLYNGYFIRLKTAFGFNEESYITFKEYKENYAEIEKLEIETFKQWVNAQRISGKLRNN